MKYRKTLAYFSNMWNSNSCLLGHRYLESGCHSLMLFLFFKYTICFLLFRLFVPLFQDSMLKNGPTPASFRLFLVFSHKQYKFYSKSIWKCPSSIWRWDLNPRPSEHESPPITNRPGLPPSQDSRLHFVT